MLSKGALGKYQGSTGLAVPAPALGLGRATRETLCSFIAVVILLLTVPCFAQDSDKSLPGLPAENAPILWLNPTDIASRNLFYGPGGQAHEPHTRFTFIKEDLSGTNPKFDVRDDNGVKWKVKLGPEAKPETVATRLLWAVGYFANEDYFLQELRVESMQPLKRGRKLVAPDGSMRNARLKRYLKGEKKVGRWRWSNNPFKDTREFNGLRVMMALINNWDLKDENNSIYEHEGHPYLHYVVTDLGSSFGTTGLSFPDASSKGNLPAYSHSQFIKSTSTQYVDFNVPTRPNLFHLVTPKEFISRMHLRWIGHHIPRADARWIGQLLGQLSADQIRDAFRAGGYSREEVERYAQVLERRIGELNRL
jgi:hypothetical protein